MLAAPTVAAPPAAARPTKPTTDTRMAASKAAALAVLGRRFKSVAEALRHEEFASTATRYYTDLYVKELGQHDICVHTALGQEQVRKLQQLVESQQTLDQAQKDDPDYVAECMRELVELAQAGVPQTRSQQLEWAAILEKTELAAKRRYCFLFMAGHWAGIVERSTGGTQPRGMPPIRKEAEAIFGADAMFCDRAIKNAVKAGHAEQAPEHKSRHSFPKELEDGLEVFVRRLRELKVPVYKHMVMDYAQRLLHRHEARLNFAKVNASGDYVRAADGNVEWDYTKLESWYYRRFLGDRKDFSTGQAGQVVLSVDFFLKTMCPSHSKEPPFVGISSLQATNAS